MRATGALPTEERVQRMNDHQWLWYYFNIKKDELDHNEKENEKWKQRLNYIGWYIDPELARRVMEADNVNNEYENYDNYDNDSIVVEGDTAFNDSFQDELNNALIEAGVQEEFTELPDSRNAGNPYESKDDFISRAMNMQNMFDENMFNENMFNENIIDENMFNENGFDENGFDENVADENAFNENVTDEINRNISNEEEIQKLIDHGINIEDIDFFEYPE